MLMISLTNSAGDNLNYDRIVSVDTCNPEHLIPIFNSTLHELTRELIHKAGNGINLFNATDLIYDSFKLMQFCDDLVQDIESDDPVYDYEAYTNALHDLFEMLDHFAANGYYFGASLGDGACYGFFEHEDGDHW